MKIQGFFCALIVLFSSCVGTDFIEDGDPVTQESLIVSPMSKAIMVGEEFSFSTLYLDKKGEETIVFPIWSSSNAAISNVSAEGKVKGLKKGMVTIYAEHNGLSSEAQLVVVEDTLEVAEVIVAAESSQLDLNETVQLNVKVLNINGNEIENKSISYVSSNTDVATVSSTGLVSTKSNGEFEVRAIVDGITSLPKVFRVGMLVREGKFTGKGNYSVKGGVMLYKNANGELIVEFENDFSSSSGPGVFIFLSNSENSVAGGIELGAIKSYSGTQTYNVSTLNSSIKIDTYSHVIVHCKPFNVVFGYAELK